MHELITQSAKLTFSGWEDVSPQDNVQAVFHFIPEDDQKFAYDQFFRKLGKYRFIDIKNVFQAKRKNTRTTNKMISKNGNKLLSTPYPYPIILILGRF